MFLPPSASPLLPKLEPCIVDGVVIVGAAFFTARVHLRSGPAATSTFPCDALLDTDSPQTFTNEQAWKQVKVSGAGSF